MQNEPSLSVAEKTNQTLLGHLYNQTLSMTLCHILVALLIAFWLSPIVAFSDLATWLTSIFVIIVSRFGLQQFYKHKNDQYNFKLWMHAWSGLSAITASVFAIGLVYFTPFSQAEYLVGSTLFIVLLCACAVAAYSASMYAVLSFMLPLIIAGCYFMLMHGGATSFIMSTVLLLFAGTALFYVAKQTDTFKKAVVSDILHKLELEKRKLVDKQLQDISRRDGLTGLFNRRYFDEVLEMEIGRARRNHTSLCLALIDIDCFKEYNHHYGHIAGDTCLMTIAELSEALANRKGDLVARYGGQVFAIILPNIDIKGAVAFANKLQQEVQSKKLPHAGTKLTTLKTVTISVGVTNLLPFAKVTPTELIEDADAALYEAKRQGRNRVHCNDKHGLGQSQ